MASGRSASCAAWREYRVTPEIKFCGLTRRGDAEVAAALGASFVGVIFAGGPRQVTPAAARDVLTGAGAARRVGVFGAVEAGSIGQIARDLALDVVQLHGDPDAAFVRSVRAGFPGLVWAVLRVSDDALPMTARALFDSADAVVLDAKVPGALGGTGVALGWEAIAGELTAVRGATPVVLAGGLTAENVGRAARAIAPAVVDVSSGVEVTPGVKDHERMRAFAAAVRAAGEGATA